MPATSSCGSSQAPVLMPLPRLTITSDPPRAVMRAGNTAVVLIKLIPTLKLAMSTINALAFHR